MGWIVSTISCQACIGHFSQPHIQPTGGSRMPETCRLLHSLLKLPSYRLSYIWWPGFSKLFRLVWPVILIKEFNFILFKLMKKKFRKNGFYEHQAECFGNPLQRQHAKTNAVGLGEREIAIKKKKLEGNG